MVVIYIRLSFCRVSGRVYAPLFTDGCGWGEIHTFSEKKGGKQIQKMAEKLAPFLEKVLGPEYIARFSFWEEVLSAQGGAAGYEDLTQWPEFESIVASEAEFLKTAAALEVSTLKFENGRVSLVGRPKNIVLLNVRPVHENCSNEEITAFFGTHGEVHSVHRFDGTEKCQIVVEVSSEAAESILKQNDRARIPSGETTCALTKRYLPLLQVIRVESTKPLILEARKPKQEATPGSVYIKDGTILKLHGEGFPSCNSAQDIGGYLQFKYCPSRQINFIDFCDETSTTVYVGFSNEDALKMTQTNICANPLPIGGKPFTVAKLPKKEAEKAKQLMFQALEAKRLKSGTRKDERAKGTKRKREGQEASRFAAKVRPTFCEICGQKRIIFNYTSLQETEDDDDFA